MTSAKGDDSKSPKADPSILGATKGVISSPPPPTSTSVIRPRHQSSCYPTGCAPNCRVGSVISAGPTNIRHLRSCSPFGCSSRCSVPDTMIASAEFLKTLKSKCDASSATLHKVQRDNRRLRRLVGTLSLKLNQSKKSGREVVGATTENAPPPSIKSPALEEVVLHEHEDEDEEDDDTKSKRSSGDVAPASDDLETVAEFIALKVTTEREQKKQKQEAAKQATGNKCPACNCNCRGGKSGDDANDSHLSDLAEEKRIHQLAWKYSKQSKLDEQKGAVSEEERMIDQAIFASLSDSQQKRELKDTIAISWFDRVDECKADADFGSDEDDEKDIAPLAPLDGTTLELKQTPARQMREEAQVQRALHMSILEEQSKILTTATSSSEAERRGDSEKKEEKEEQEYE